MEPDVGDVDVDAGEAARRDATNPYGQAVDGDDAADHIWVAAELALPERPRHDRRGGGHAESRLLRRNRSLHTGVRPAQRSTWRVTHALMTERLTLVRDANGTCRRKKMVDGNAPPLLIVESMILASGNENRT